MPKLPIDYSKTIIYKIVCKDLTVKELYVGHTTNFIRRKSQHKSRCYSGFDLKVYDFINKNGGWGNWDMIQVEEMNIPSANEARARERFWYEELKGSLNSIIPNRNKKEYINDNQEKIKVNQKLYYEENKEKLIEYNKEYYNKNNNKIVENNKQYREDHKEKIRQVNKVWRDKNKETLKLKKQKFYYDNKEKITEKRKLYREANKELIKQKKKRFL